MLAEIVYVVLIHTADGTRVSVWKSPEGAKRTVEQYVREEWPEKIEEPMPTDMNAAIREYFQRNGMDESYETFDTYLGE